MSCSWVSCSGVRVGRAHRLSGHGAGHGGAAILWRWARGAEAAVRSIASVAIVALGLRIAQYGHRDVARIGYFEAHVDLLFSKAVIATWGLPCRHRRRSLLRTRRLDAVAAGLRSLMCSCRRGVLVRRVRRARRRTHLIDRRLASGGSEPERETVGQGLSVGLAIRRRSCTTGQDR